METTGLSPNPLPTTRRVEQKKRRKRSTGKLDRVHTNAAGVGVGSTFHVAAVSGKVTESPVQAFKSFTADLHAMADWLSTHGVKTVAMESTGVYWNPLFEVLESRGFEVLLVNARDVKNVPGRKTDVNDAQWLQQLHEHGLLRGSFRPREDIARLRSYMRQRDRMIEFAASHIQHMQKALMQMNVQLHHVVTDITGGTGMKIIRAIIAGECDPERLVQFRDRRCKESPETIVAALSGNYRREHVFALRQAVDFYDFHQTKIRECDKELEAMLPCPREKTRETCRFQFQEQPR